MLLSQPVEIAFQGNFTKAHHDTLVYCAFFLILPGDSSLGLWRMSVEYSMLSSSLFGFSSLELTKLLVKVMACLRVLVQMTTTSDLNEVAGVVEETSHRWLWSCGAIELAPRLHYMLVLLEKKNML